MSGRYMRLRPGRYTLTVPGGEGPAGIRRQTGVDVRLGIDGGRVEFEVGREEEVYYWWRGPRERPGVGLHPRDRASGRTDGEGDWATDIRA